MDQKEASATWFEIPVTDMSRAVTFYEQIFQISMHTMQMGDDLEMALFPRGEHKTGGSLIRNPDFYHPSNTQGPLIYLNANPDLKQVENRVEAAGGKITIHKRQISPEFGYMAVIEDTEGNRVALFSEN
ncbi:VOC family protein [Balneola sp. MJW-20]|uniref:VOC family protein n=1 Tax=Gracilimonas aurantiaca TaxID=3234185 RepID=UPI00346578DA